jgi:hypothetical protein
VKRSTHALLAAWFWIAIGYAAVIWRPSNTAVVVLAIACANTFLCGFLVLRAIEDKP